MRGFTLLELVLVIAIIGIAAAITLPRYQGSITEHRLKAASERIVRDLEFARQRARYMSQAQQVVFDTANGLYRVVGATALDRPGATYEVKLTDAPYEVRILSATFGGDATVTFDGYGIPDSGGTVQLDADGARVNVLLDGSTGVAREISVAGI